MKIGSINVNGINAFTQSRYALSKQLFDAYHPEILCIQETKGDTSRVCNSLSRLGNLGYKVYVNDSKTKAGYAGVSILVSDNITSNYSVREVDLVKYIDDIETWDIGYLSKLKYYISGRVIEYEDKDNIIISVYVMNSGGKDYYRMDFDKLFNKYVRSLNHIKSIFILGDMNVCHTELDMWNWSNQLNTSPGLMQFEIDGFNKLLKDNYLCDTFRQLHPTERRYSWSAPKVPIWTRGWRLDYILTNNLSRVKSSDIVDKLACSDHRYIECEIKL